MAETVSEIVCECGRRAYIQKTSRKGDYLQKRCGTSRNDGCGLNQQTGDWVQSYWRKNMVPVGSLVAGVDYQAHPRDLEAEQQAQVSDPEKKEQVTDPEPEQNRELVEEGSGSGLGLGSVVVGLFVVGLSVLGIRSTVNWG
ncbi:hypothetical protein [Oceanospirillum maris]|uniref:hypothetical protein n=1 Tax=Oceanospirillum maris TaxID=64977 RepID=UPI000411E6F0|nr:hypothetical protein [Oceanospirillum maris]